MDACAPDAEWQEMKSHLLSLFPTFPHPPPSLKPQLIFVSSPIAEDLLRAGPEQSDTQAVKLSQPSL